MTSQDTSEEVRYVVADVAIPSSFDAFYRSEFPRMVRIAYALSGSRLAAEDLAQDAMIAAHRRWDRVGVLDKPGAWTRRVVLNRAASLYQRRMAELRAVARLGPLRGSLPPALDAESEHLWHEVRCLPRRQGQAVALFYVDDMAVHGRSVTVYEIPAAAIDEGSYDLGILQWTEAPGYEGILIPWGLDKDEALALLDGLTPISEIRWDEVQGFEYEPPVATTIVD